MKVNQANWPAEQCSKTYYSTRDRFFLRVLLWCPGGTFWSDPKPWPASVRTPNQIWRKKNLVLSFTILEILGENNWTNIPSYISFINGSKSPTSFHLKTFGAVPPALHRIYIKKYWKLIGLSQNTKFVFVFIYG